MTGGGNIVSDPFQRNISLEAILGGVTGVSYCQKSKRIADISMSPACNIMFVNFLIRMQSSSKNTWIPHCREYCDGNIAEFYCPECAAMFCGSCYDREHCGNERKSQHGKLTELRAICSVHKHTLDYFNLTLLQPMCVICKKETILAPEHAHHVIENIETTVPKLRSLIEKKLESASELIDRLTCELAKVEKDARRTTTKSIIFIQRCFVRLRHLLDQREVELLQGVRGYFDEFVEDGEGRVEAQNALSNLKALSEEGGYAFICP